MSDDEEINVVDVSDDEEPTTKKRRVSYSNALKSEIVDYARRSTVSGAARKFSVDRKCVRRWMQESRKIHEEIKSGNSKKARMSGAGRHLNDVEFDEKLKEWVNEKRANKLLVSRRLIKLQAATFSKDPSFRASTGWLEKFMQRHNFSLRRGTTVCQKPPEALQETVVNFLIYMEKLRSENDYQQVYAADETAVYIDCRKSLTVNEKGARTVSIKTTGHEKMHITVMLTARDDGFKCKPFVLLPLKRVNKEIVKEFGQKLELSWAGRTFFNDELTSEYLHKTFGSTMFGKRLLVWDSFRCHLSADTKKVLRKLKIETATVPGGCTKFIQAPDVFWNSPFKAKISAQYENWMAHGQMSYTTGGNMRSPPMSEYLRWIVQAWDEIPNELIRKSFIGCGLNNAADGSDDDHLVCFRSDGEMPDGKEILRICREEHALEKMDEILQMIDLGESENSDDEDAPLDFFD